MLKKASWSLFGKLSFRATASDAGVEESSYSPKLLGREIPPLSRQGGIGRDDERTFQTGSYIIVAITFLVLVIHLFFGWMITNTDTFFFAAFAQFLRTGKYTFPIPTLPYKHIHTGSPPLYSLLLAVLFSFKRGDIALHILQILMLVITALTVYKILKNYFKTSLAAVISCLFLLIPANLVYVSLVMSDLGAQFLFCIYCYLIYRYLITKKTKYLAFSVLAGFVVSLWRYSFVVFGCLSLLFFIIKHPKGAKNYIFPGLGMILILSWILIQHVLTGVWGLTVDANIRYNLQMMWRAKVLPEENHPSMREIRKYIPKEVDLKQAYWDLEKYLVSSIGYDYIKMTKLVGDVGKAAMYEHPVEFVKVSFDSFYKSHIGSPYQENLRTFGLNYSIDFPPLYCEQIETVDLCRPIIKTKYSYPVWNAYIRAANFFYNTVFPFYSFFIFFPALLWGLFSPGKVLRVFSFLFLAGRLPIAMATFPAPRYVLPFYPLMVIITCLAIKDLISKFQIS